jgi:hypothetical protein
LRNLCVDLEKEFTEKEIKKINTDKIELLSMLCL